MLPNKKFKAKEIVNTLIGKVSAIIKAHRIDDQEFFGIGKDKDDAYWMALLRQVMVKRTHTQGYRNLWSNVYHR